jgi:hypothetical protein
LGDEIETLEIKAAQLDALNWEVTFEARYFESVVSDFLPLHRTAEALKLAVGGSATSDTGTAVPQRAEFQHGN